MKIKDIKNLKDENLTTPAPRSSMTEGSKQLKKLIIRNGQSIIEEGNRVGLSKSERKAING